MYEELLFIKCDFCGRGIPKEPVKADCNGKTMNFCEEACLQICLEYDKIRGSNAWYSLDPELLEEDGRG